MNSMKLTKQLAVIALVGMSTSALFAIQSKETKGRKMLLEAKGADYIPTNHLYRDIYGNSGGMFTAEYTLQLHKNWYGFLGGSIYTKEGHSIGAHSLTKIMMLPITFGVKYLKNLDYGDWYLGMGAFAPWVHIHDYAAGVIPKRKQWGIGGNWKLGMNVNIDRSLFLDIFGEYTYLKMKFNNCCIGAPDMKANFSGASVGLGLGYRF